jgi:hypothetical protein
MKICFWCGKKLEGRSEFSPMDILNAFRRTDANFMLEDEHSDCERYNRLMNEACKEVETWVLMRMLEVHGVQALENWRALAPQYATCGKGGVKK